MKVDDLQISLMENDLQLLQKLLALGDSIQELKCRKQAGSGISLNSLQEDPDEKVKLQFVQLLAVQDSTHDAYLREKPRSRSA